MDFTMQVALIMLPVFFILLFLGVPISISIGISSVLSALVIIEPGQMAFQGVQKMFGGINNFGMLAVPFFMLAGNIMNRGGIAKRLINLALLMGGRLPGALAMANVQGNMLFGTLSGSAMACCAAIGGTMSPIQKEKGYDKGFSTAVNIASAPTGLLIPPSGMLVLFSLISGGTSVAALFMAGWIPGLLWGLAVMLVAYYFAKRDNLPVEKSPETLSQVLKIVADAVPSLFLIVIVIGGIVGGAFTATEGAAIAVVYSLVLAVVYRTLNRKVLIDVVMDTALMTGIILFLIAASSIMSWVMAFSQIPQMISDLLLSITDNKIILLLIINIVLLIVGVFMDATPAVLIFTPILMPICVNQFGMDPVHFGLMIIFNLGIGSITPPVGSVLFVGCAVGDVSIEKATPYLVPMFFSILLVLGMVTYIPAVSMFIPELFGLVK